VLAAVALKREAMIYRILVAQKKFTYSLLAGQMVGADFSDDYSIVLGGCNGILDMPFKGPQKRFKRRARFYFTEKGWDLYGRDMCKEAYNWGYRNGHNIIVIRRKNPRRSEIVYRDKIQVAILPECTKK